MAAVAAMVPKVMICATLSSPYFSRDVIDDFAAARVVQKSMSMSGMLNALGIEEALEQQTVLRADRRR